MSQTLWDALQWPFPLMHSLPSGLQPVFTTHCHYLLCPANSYTSFNSLFICSLFVMLSSTNFGCSGGFFSSVHMALGSKVLESWMRQRLYAWVAHGTQLDYGQCYFWQIPWKVKEAKCLEVCIECPFFIRMWGGGGNQEVFLFAGVWTREIIAFTWGLGWGEGRRWVTRF